MLNTESINDPYPTQQTVPVICSFDCKGNIQPLYIRIDDKAFKIQSSYKKHSVFHTTIFQCEIVDCDQLKPLILEYRHREHLWLIPKQSV